MFTPSSLKWGNETASFQYDGAITQIERGKRQVPPPMPPLALPLPFIRPPESVPVPIGCGQMPRSPNIASEPDPATFDSNGRGKAWGRGVDGAWRLPSLGIC